MNISLMSLKLTIGLLFMDFKSMDFDRALNVRSQIWALRLLLGSGETPESFTRIIEGAYRQIDTRVNELVGEDEPATGTEDKMARPKTTPLYEQLSYQQQTRLRARLAHIEHWSGDEVCVYLGIKRQRLNEMVSEGRIKRIYGHGGPRMFSRVSVFKAMEKQNINVCVGLKD